MTQLALNARRRTRAVTFAAIAAATVALTMATAARAGEHDFYSWRDGYAGPVYGYYVAGPYGYYYPVYEDNDYPALGFYGARSYYSYYYGRPDFGYQDTK